MPVSGVAVLVVWMFAGHAQERPLNELEGLDDLRASCPPGTHLAGPTGPDGSEITVNGRRAAACVKPDGARHGPAVTWYPNGAKATAGSYRDDLKDGPWLFWHENGQLSGRGNFRQDRPDGLWTTWHSNGQKESEGVYADGVPQGRFTRWDPDGNLT